MCVCTLLYDDDGVFECVENLLSLFWLACPLAAVFAVAAAAAAVVFISSLVYSVCGGGFDKTGFPKAAPKHPQSLRRYTYILSPMPNCDEMRR